MKATLLFDSRCVLAESPVWEPTEGRYLWVDIENGTLFRLKRGDTTPEKWSFPHRLTMIIPDGNGQYLLSLDRKLAKFDPESEQLDWLCEVEQDKQDNRWNDGACDSKGRLWAGTMSTKFTKNAGSLYLVDKDRVPQKVIDLVSISNGICWSLDERTLYYIDSPTRKIQAFDFDLEKGFISFNRVAVTIPEELGTPDGMCMDQNGKLWVAHYGGFGVYCWDPETSLQLDKIDVPAPHVTSCAFSGPDNDELLITTARENLSAEKIQRYPQSGSVFTCKVPVKGAQVYGPAF
ncbi:SMP-30/gluconolactonase/LRE family protein [Cyclobacterium jeungdonense]|uniref:SMP-30/gluconolactonase/LRE family protein n=1 Tax=Cyclobacterium jeungdonense TaxID=708087 RepID=A0ABT8CD84_9BACT|nr:SMP-30/gluconolactonase/LRE family protein [Cyclobacterium jeungdonense]MDN3690366.1 SMP-30/gluconolactonase/LRE family protein [Cyclobacterium jeungdonense]